MQHDAVKSPFTIRKGDEVWEAARARSGLPENNTPSPFKRPDGKLPAGWEGDGESTSRPLEGLGSPECTGKREEEDDEYQDQDEEIRYASPFRRIIKRSESKQGEQVHRTSLRRVLNRPNRPGEMIA